MIIFKWKILIGTLQLKLTKNKRIMETIAENLTIDELIKINVDVLKNFIEGDRKLLAQRVKDNPVGNVNYEYYKIEDVVNDLLVGIMEGAFNSTSSRVGSLEIAKFKCLLH